MIGALADVLREYAGAVMGVIPGGRGNDLARVLGIPEDPERAAAVIAAGHSRALDLGLVLDSSSGGGRAFVGIASVGFDSEANRIANEAPSWLGSLVYAYGALRALIAWKPARFELVLDPPTGRRISFTAYTVGAANSQAYGGGMRAAPEALLDDGLLEVVVLESVSKRAFLTRILPRASAASTSSSRACTRFAPPGRINCERAFAMYADGDPIGELPLCVRALKGDHDVGATRGRRASAFRGNGSEAKQPSGGEHS
jgi:diacylglycerol kinase family enzyme